MAAYGNVKVISDDSVKLFSNSILWDNHYKLITSNDFVSKSNPETSLIIFTPYSIPFFIT